jgi:predicted acylesterase/phospholipase RssA
MLAGLTLASSDNADRCLALSLSGGANKGAYEAGALWQMVRSLPAEDTQYDVYTGVSVGSINAFFLSLYEKGDEL